MSTKVSKLVYLTMLVVLLLTTAMPLSSVYAAPSLSDKDPETRKLIEKDKVIGPNGEVLILELYEQVTLTTQPKMSSNLSPLVVTSGCKVFTMTAQGKNILGMVVYEYNQSIDWCYDGTKITYVSRRDWPDRTAGGWVWKGRIQGPTTSGGVGSSSYTSYVQGYFCFVEAFSCIYNKYPWFDMKVNGDGTQSGSGSSGI